MNYKELQKKLGYKFHDLTLLRIALTHCSIISSVNNERLEFLGDAILNFIISTELFKRFPKKREGILTRMKSVLVQGNSCFKISEILSLNKYIKISAGEQKENSFHRSSIMSDALEAIFGAIYLDSNINNTYQCVIFLFSDILKEINFYTDLKDSKTILQEYLQLKNYIVPEYYLEKILDSTYIKQFIVCCKINIMKKKIVSFGTSKKKAEQSVSEKILLLLKNII